MTDEEKLITICDDRFEIIARARKHIIEATNIEMSPKEMEVLDNFLFRCWQMGWLKNDYKELEKQNEELKEQIKKLKNNYKKQRNRRIDDLQKKNAELKAQNKSLKNTLQAIATDTNEHITHNLAQNELDKWELNKRELSE